MKCVSGDPEYVGNESHAIIMIKKKWHISIPNFQMVIMFSMCFNLSTPFYSTMSFFVKFIPGATTSRFVTL